MSGKLFGGNQIKLLVALSNRLLKRALIVGVMMAALGALFYEQLGSLFTTEKAVLTEFYKVFWIVLLMQPFCALAFVFDGIFKGLGEMKTLRNVLVLSTVVVFIPALFIGDYYELKLHGILLAFTFWMIARGIPLIVKFRKQFLPQIQNH